jgi:hypothetical protein
MRRDFFQTLLLAPSPLSPGGGGGAPPRAPLAPSGASSAGAPASPAPAPAPLEKDDVVVALPSPPPVDISLCEVCASSRSPYPPGRAPGPRRASNPPLSDVRLDHNRRQVTPNLAAAAPRRPAPVRPPQPTSFRPRLTPRASPAIFFPPLTTACPTKATTATLLFFADAVDAATLCSSSP